MEELFKELSKFARENREALKLAEQWFNKFDDGDVENVWISAGQPFDWRKIVFIAWLASDKKIYECKLEIDGFNLRQWCGCDRNKDGQTPQENFLYDVILRVDESYSTENNPSLYLIRNALNEGKKVVAGSLNDTSNIVLSDEEQSVLEELAGRPGETLTIRRLSKHLKTPESTIRDRVNRLKKMGLADKMEGRHGFFATDTGIKWYNIRWNK